MDILAKIQRKLRDKRLFFVCRDIERASAGLILNLPNFNIITNDSPYARILSKKDKRILIVKNKEILDTKELLLLSQKIIKPRDLIMVFKPTTQIEKICLQNKWRLINPSANLASQVEEKISQVKWLGSVGKKYLPNYKIAKCEDIKWPGKKFVLQFNHSHTGSGTILIESKKQLQEIAARFPNRPARYAKYILGPLFTNNNAVWGNKILIGNINYQITGLKPFTNNPFATIGNDWALPYKILNKNQLAQYKKIALAVGKKMAQSGWKGIFGIDVILEEASGKLYLLEINARQAASTTYESELQNLYKKENNITTFEAHLLSLLEIKYENENLVKISDGAQIIQRKISAQKTSVDKNFLKNNKVKIISYNNKKPDEDLFRFQTEKNIMENHNKINKLGKLIASSLKTK